MPTTVTEIFDSLVEEIKSAVAERGFLSVCDRATELGLTGDRSDSKLAVDYRFEGSDAAGAVISLHVRSYDPSGPMQVRPRLTRFTSAITEDRLVKMEYEGEYEGSGQWRQEVAMGSDVIGQSGS